MTPTGLEILSAMITPAVLISASGTLVLSTSVRLARVVDRVRTLSYRPRSPRTNVISRSTDTRVSRTSSTHP